ncbi:unnamed protein product, partial [Rotaria sordida]
KCKSTTKNYQEAIKYLNRSFVKHRNTDIIKRKEEIEKILKEKERLAYINPELTEQEKTKGNEFFQTAGYSNALKHYAETIKRNPSDETMEGYQQCAVRLSDDPEEICKRALADSEIQQILDDPGMYLILD